jgi:prepilin-type processing-associated H-X9-DG protein
LNQFNNLNLSYAIGVKADASQPNAILDADRNFPSWRDSTHSQSSTIGVIPAIVGAHWGTALHERKGNVLFADTHVEESFDAMIPSEETAANDLVYPDVKVSAGFVSFGDGGGADAPGFGSAVSSRPVENAPQFPANNNESSNQTSAAGHRVAPNSSTGTNPPAQPQLVQFNGQSVGRNFSPASPATIQTADESKTRGVIQAQTSSKLTTATDDNAGMSYFDRRVTKILRKVFGWGYSLLLLFFLVWLSLKLRREWRLWQERRQQR